METIIGYYPYEIDEKRWQKVELKNYKKIFNHDLAITYLKNEIKESVEREISGILKNNPQSFYSCIRYLFAETNALADLYWNNYEAKYVVRFMKKFGILQPYPGIQYEVFRHGLMHTHMPKWISKHRKLAGWYVSSNAELNIFGISIPVFKYQVIQSIDKFIEELEKEKLENTKNRLNKFFSCYCKWAKILKKSDLKLYAQADFSKLEI